MFFKIFSSPSSNLFRRFVALTPNPTRHRNQLSFKLSLFSSFLVHVASRRRHARLATNAVNPAGASFSFPPFLFPFSPFLLFFFPSPSSFFSFSSCSLLTRCTRAPLHPRTPRAPGCPARRSAPARTVSSSCAASPLALPLLDAERH